MKQIFTVDGYKNIYDLEEIYCSLIKQNYIDTNMTNFVNNQIISQNPVPFSYNLESEKHHDFLEIRNYVCDLINNTENVQADSIKISTPTSIFNKYGFLQKTDYFAFEVLDDNYEKGWHRPECKFIFIVYSKTILVFISFIDSNKRKPPEFLCALYPNALQLEFSTRTVENKVVVDEKTKHSIEYYDIYNPISDAKIVKRKWEKTNRDGTRSFAGGLKPENNKLCLTYEFGIITVCICGGKVETGFSNLEKAKNCSKNYNCYISTLSSANYNTNSNQSLLFEQGKEKVIKFTQKTLYEKFIDLDSTKKTIIICAVLIGGIFVISLVCAILSLLFESFAFLFELLTL